jgi:hypothetical protein
MGRPLAVLLERQGADVVALDLPGHDVSDERAWTDLVASLDGRPVHGLVNNAIVNVGSLAALTGHYPVAYTASKWALRGLTHSAATELGPRGIRVNIVLPGFIETEMTARAPAAARRPPGAHAARTTRSGRRGRGRRRLPAVGCRRLRHGCGVTRGRRVLLVRLGEAARGSDRRRDRRGADAVGRWFRPAPREAR